MVIFWNFVIYTCVIYRINKFGLTSKDKNDGKFVESVIGFNDMKAFVCENRKDQDAFNNEMRDNLKLKGHLPAGYRVSSQQTALEWP